MKIIGDDGSIRGWFIALCETILVYGLWVVSLFYPPISQYWPAIVPVYLGTFGTWLAYTGFKYYTDKAQGEGI